MSTRKNLLIKKDTRPEVKSVRFFSLGISAVLIGIAYWFDPYGFHEGLRAFAVIVLGGPLLYLWDRVAGAEAWIGGYFVNSDSSEFSKDISDVLAVLIYALGLYFLFW